MEPDSKSELIELRSPDASVAMRWTKEKRLCRIIESEQTSSEEKYQALMDLAKIFGVPVRGLADAA